MISVKGKLPSPLPRGEESLDELLVRAATDSTAVFCVSRRLCSLSDGKYSCGLERLLNNVNWAGMDESYRLAFKELVINVATTLPRYLPCALKSALSPKMGSGGGCRLEIMADLVTQIVALAPAASDLLVRLIAKHFPGRLSPLDEFSAYVSLVIELARRMRFLGPSLVELLLENALNLDLLVQSELATNEAIENVMSQKLDTILSSLLSLFASDFCEQMFCTVLSVFERSILTTFRSKYTQFVLFYVTSLLPGLSDVFLGFLIKRLLTVDDLGGSLVTVATAAYIGSYVVRANFLSDSLVRVCFDMLITCALRLLNEFDESSRTNLIEIYHAVCQTIMYVVIFRRESIFGSGDDAGSTYRRHLNYIMASELNPLSWCLSSVVEGFIAVSDQLDLVDCRAILHRSSRSAPPATHSSLDQIWMLKGKGEGEGFYRGLDSFFPFDPISLEKTSVYITESMYRSQ